MSDPITESLSRWSLDRLQFMLAHLEGFLDDEAKELKQRAAQFVVEGDMNQVEDLVVCDPNDPALPRRVLERLMAFYESGVLLQRGPSHENAGWWITDLFWRGNLFHLDLKDQIQATALVPELPPLQVNRAPAHKVLGMVKLPYLAPPDADIYLIKPTPTLAYGLISNLGAPWSPDHVANTQRLINKCFIY